MNEDSIWTWILTQLTIHAFQRWKIECILIVLESILTTYTRIWCMCPFHYIIITLLWRRPYMDRQIYIKSESLREILLVGVALCAKLCKPRRFGEFDSNRNLTNFIVLLTTVCSSRKVLKNSYLRHTQELLKYVLKLYLRIIKFHNSTTEISIRW